MELPIEVWLRKITIPGEAHTAFREAITCYKGGGYRAALLFSYLAFGLTLRARMLAMTVPPAGFAVAEWDARRRTLMSDESWDATVFDVTQMRIQAGKGIFDVTDDLRHQVRHWKDRRNDCAHFKSNEILASHVETLWSFLRSNIGKFVPLGSREGVLQRILDHFDPDRTQPGLDPMPIIRDVPSSVEVADFPQFLFDVSAKLIRMLFGTIPDPQSQQNVAVFYDCIVRLGHKPATDALLDLLKANPERAVDLFEVRPGHVQLFHSDPAWIRELWRTRLFVVSRHSSSQIFAALLRNGLIPLGELVGAAEHAADNLRVGVAPGDDFNVLNGAGVFAAFASRAFDSPATTLDRFPWSNDRAWVLAWYVGTFGVDARTAKALSEVFRENKPYPVKSRDAIKAVLHATPGLLAALLAECTAQQLELPDALV